MKDGVVTREMLMQIRFQTWPKGTRQMLADLALVEPDLAIVIHNMTHNALRLLDDFEVPQQIAEPLEELLLAITINAILGVQQGHAVLWRHDECLPPDPKPDENK